VLAALGAPGSEQRGLPTARELERGAGLVEQVGADSSGRFFAARSSPKGVSPAHKMLHQSVDGLWYCQGKRDGCPLQHHCSHILAAKLAIQAGHVHFAQGLLLGQDALSRARQWLEQWDGVLPLLGRSGRSSELRASCEGSGEEEAHLMGLISGQRPEPAGCAGAECFCQEHQQVFGAAEPSLSTPQGAGASQPWAGARRSKQWWRSHAGGAPLTVAPQRVQEPPAEALGKDAIRCWVASCGSCMLEGALRGCQHAGAGRAPVMVQETQAIQVTQPKLSQLSDNPDFHDPWVTRLRCGPIRVSKLVGRDFQELGELGMLSAPCPLQPPLCGGDWVELWQDAVVHASTWSQAVRTRIYSCKCSRKHTIHYDGEHLGLYVWSRQTIVVQESLQLLLKQMQRARAVEFWGAAGGPARGLPEGSRVRRALRGDVA
jgi:hypothetical protein